MIYLVTTQTTLYPSIEDGIQLMTFENAIIGLESLGNIIGADTETKGFDPHTKAIISLQLGNSQDQYVFDDTIDLKKLTFYFQDPTKVFVFHNAKFDLKFLYKLKIIPYKVFDTYLAEKLLYLGYPGGAREMSLQACVSNYLGIYLDKTVRGSIHKEGLTTRVIRYAADDIKYSVPLYEAQYRELIKKDLTVAIDIENEFVKSLAYVEYCGIKLDAKKWEDKMFQDSIALFEAKKALDLWVIQNAPSKYRSTFIQGNLFTGFPEVSCEINWASPKQVAPFFEELGFNVTVKDKVSGKLKSSVEANIIEPQKHLSPVAELYLKYKECEKVVSTYGESFLRQINPVTKRIHTQFTQLMETGRLSSGGKNKDTKEEYINLQNLPKGAETRSCFIAPKDSVLIDCDYTAQEDLVFTELSKELKLIELYNSKEKRDGHSLVAKMCFPKDLESIPEAEVSKKRPDLRSTAKKAKFAIHYGGNGATISKNLSLPIEQGINIEKAYLENFPGIHKYFSTVKAEAWKRGYILISEITGHKRFIYDWETLKSYEKQFTRDFWNKYSVEKKLKTKKFEEELKPIVSEYFQKRGNIDRNALNTPVQGTSAIITKIATIKLFNYLLKNDLLFTVLIVNLIHDEILVECPKPLSKHIASVLQKCMEDAGKLFCKTVTLKAVPEIGTYWLH